MDEEGPNARGVDTWREGAVVTICNGVCSKQGAPPAPTATAE
jgi:hypothetical protein